jgi:hypothetical protein
MDSATNRPSERNFKEKNLSTFPIRDLYPEQKKPPRHSLYRNRIGHISISHFRDFPCIFVIFFEYF